MARRFDHYRLSAEDLSSALSEAGLQPVEFERLTGVSRTGLASWLLPEDHPKAQEPPFWVTTWLALYHLPGAAQIVEQLAADNLIPEDEHAPGR